VSYGVISGLSDRDHRVAIRSTPTLFVLGLALLFTVEERRGRLAQRSYPVDGES
jgi:UMF1 family MFS transporter